jgi:outer membrane protein OmpA-like peptidoglycan-associated protein
MRKALLKFGALVATATVFAPATAKADGPDLSLRIEPGVAFPLTSPQRDRFSPGGDLVLKPTMDITPWLDISPTFSVMALPSQLNGIDVGTEYGVGVGFRVKRPHSAASDASDLSAAISPWFDTDEQLIATGPLARMSLSLAAGASVPTSASRSVWIGPFVRYTDIVQDKNNARFDNSDAHVLIVGISIELGAAAKKAPAPRTSPIPTTHAVVLLRKQLEAPPPQPVEPPATQAEVIEIHEKVQFPFDSATMLPESYRQLGSVLSTLLSHPGWSVRIEGHASSEGQDAHNDELATRRAQTVADFLTNRGVPADRLTVKGFGSRVPVVPNDTQAGREANRRVEFFVNLIITKEAGDTK